MINDHQKSKGSSTLVRASSSNVKLFGNLGNLRLRQGGMMNYHAMQRKENPIANGRYTNNKVENVDRGSKEQSCSLCMVLPARNGNFAEALALHALAIAIDHNKPFAHLNRAHLRLGNLNIRLVGTDMALIITNKQEHLKTQNEEVTRTWERRAVKCGCKYD
ncbi:Inactive TPR repeat-containing thioredoxin TTL3 [Sesbania bispinosa]|nr:Inactive TPR repeat-containing thioredoxin TTL3 [Sesbania bispinosa]